ncbi:MAG: 1,4-alpha-glucan branching enzyme, partial [Desulfuromonadales bacterium]
MANDNVIYCKGLLTEHDIYLFKEGRHYRLYEKLGAHIGRVGRRKGTHFAVWAPNADQVHVMGDFNDWSITSHPLAIRQDESGIFEGFIPGIGHGTRYKYHISTHGGGYQGERGDPFALYWELPPNTASVVWDPEYVWTDEEWLTARHNRDTLQEPMSIYEMHLGSWRRPGDDPSRVLTYLELAELLPDYLEKTGFTHVEFLPIMEHPFYGSWGYQCLGYFAPTSRYGTPQEFMQLIDVLHQRGFGVILDWVPSHFPSDAHGLIFYDGTHLYEHADRRQGFHPDWRSEIFNYGRNEVRAFLISSAFFWLDRYHADGLRVDAVASMLYLDYSRKPGEWIPNRYGGRENLDAIEFMRAMNEAVYREFPGIQTIAEESTAWPMVSRPL